MQTLAILLDGLFDALFSRFVRAFERRADLVYGRCAQPSPPDATVTRLPRLMRPASALAIAGSGKPSPAPLI
jgi:hypothetical protein